MTTPTPCACGCGAPITPTSPSPYFATEPCATYWTQQNGGSRQICGALHTTMRIRCNRAPHMHIRDGYQLHFHHTSSAVQEWEDSQEDQVVNLLQRLAP